MAGVEWARASRFNWVYDAMGGTPLMEVVAGNWSGATATVGADNTVLLQAPLPGSGKVYYLRGVWQATTVFPWRGFWAEPETGDLTNYYTGGSWENQGRQTVVRLGQALPPGTVVQLYYLYLTGETASKYEALNSYPCIRRAWRGWNDYTYDYAVDRIFDLMAVLEFARREGRLENGPEVQNLLWEEYYQHAGSATVPLVWDDFERTAYDRGAYLLYYGGSRGLQDYGRLRPALVPGTTNRALRVELATDKSQAGDSYWLGYGFNWRLTEPPFTGLNRLYFTWAGNAAWSRVTDFRFLSAGGTARLRLREDYRDREPGFVWLTITKGGGVGEAEYTFAFYRYDATAPEKQGTGLLTGSLPTALWPGVEIWWDPGGDLVAGDSWYFSLGLASQHPRRLQVVLNNAPPGAADPWGPEYTYVVAIPDRYAELQAFELPFSRFVRLDNIIFDADRRRTAWHPWCAGGTAARPGWLQVLDHEVAAEIEGEVFYTQTRLLWHLPTPVTALGFWNGLNPEEVNSQGQEEINFLLKPELAGSNPVTLTVKLKDRLGRYFTTTATVPNCQWSRLTLNLAAFQPEEAGTQLIHPITVVDLGLAGADLPQDGCIWLAEVKFGAYRRFPGDRLRLVEFKYQESELVLPPFSFWLDNFGFNLEVADRFPYCPRLALSLTPWGRNPWRGPTLVHYAHPLGPYLVGRHDLKNYFLALHREAQEEYHRRYGGVKGPIMPLHTRNEVENIALCGEENFDRFGWWPKYRHYGKRLAAWHFNGDLRDAEGNFPLSYQGTVQNYTTGICQPGATAWVNDGSNRYPYCSDGRKFLFRDRDFTIEIVARFTTVGTGTDCLAAIWQGGTPGQRSWAVYRSGNSLSWAYSLDGVNLQTISGSGINSAGTYYHLVVTRRAGVVSLFVNGERKNQQMVPQAFYNSSAPLTIGKSLTGWPGNLKGAIDFLAIYQDYGMEAAEVAGRWRTIQGLENGSAYPEVGHALGQYWAFQRLAEYYCLSGDGGAWDILEPWLTWFASFLANDGAGWRLPVWFSEYGFGYGRPDPGAQASVAIGCLYIYCRRGDSRALELAQKLLSDLRQRPSGDYGGYLYKSDYHYAWLNALVAHAFGLAVTGRAGAAYRYPATPEEAEHFSRMIQNFFACRGDLKPNLLNQDLIPFSYVEDQDIWDYAPHYVFMRQMGSLEAVVLMLQAALDWALFSGQWDWFQRLRSFLLRDNYCQLPASQIRTLAVTQDFSHLTNLVRVFFGDYQADASNYAEERDEAGIDQWGPQPLEVNLAYGQPVITEDPQMAARLAQRWLQRLGRPRELVAVETWLAASRVQIKDRVRITAPDLGYEEEDFICYQKELDLERGRIALHLSRELQPRWSWVTDLGGEAGTAQALDSLDPDQDDWRWRTYVY